MKHQIPFPYRMISFGLFSSRILQPLLHAWLRGCILPHFWTLFSAFFSFFFYVSLFLKWYIYGYLLQNTWGVKSLWKPVLLYPSDVRRRLNPPNPEISSCYHPLQPLRAHSKLFQRYMYKPQISIQFGHSILMRYRDFWPTFPAIR